MNLFSLSNLLVSITSFILGIILLIYGKNKLHRIWMMLNFSVLTWGIGTFLVSITNSLFQVSISWRIAGVGGIFLAVFFYHTVYILSGVTKKSMLFLVYLQAIVFSVLLFFAPDRVIFGNWRLVFGSIYYNKASFGYTLMALSWCIVAILGHYELSKFIKKTKGTQHVQGLYLLYGFLIGFIGGGSVLLPTWGISLYPIGNFGVTLYAVIGTYAILKYRLMDVKVAFTRAGIFIAIYTLVLGLPFAAAISLKNQLIQLFGAWWWMSPLVLMAALATAGPFIYIYLDRKAEDRLLREQRRYQEALKQASAGMTRIRNLRKLLDLIAHIVTKTVRISYAGIYLHNKETDEYVLQVSRDKGGMPISKLASDDPLISWIMVKREPLIYEEVKRQMEDTNDETYKLLEKNMRELTASVIIPSFLADRFMGFFVLGDKISGEIYTPEDLNVFQVLASQAALAIENAQVYAETQEMQEQIAQAEKMATVGTMADGLSHQINNRFYALSLIAGDTIDTIKLTDISKCSPEIKEMINKLNYALERIQANVIQGGEVVRGILKYTRKGEEGFEPLGLDQILDGALDMVQYKIKLSEIDIARNYPKDHPKIRGNLVQLQETFFNFFDNGYDSTVERKTILKEAGYRGRITFSAQAQQENGMLLITVEDNGMGIKEENKKKIFAPFFTTKASAHKGTGLGLYVIKRTIEELHKGKIWFESEYGKGTKFFIQMPLA